MYKRFFKHIIDFLIAFTALVVLSPLLFIVVILLALANKGNPFFFQSRPGKDARIFKIVKFRTMTSERDEKGGLLPDVDRLTGIGKFVRKASIDELPQLVNVLMGDMSLVGPRPLLPEYLPFYSKTQNRRHEVKPGITGWAQVNGRNAISWSQKFDYDVWYVDHLSFILDVKIVLKTFKKVIATKEISADGHATMPRFDDIENSI